MRVFVTGWVDHDFGFSNSGRLILQQIPDTSDADVRWRIAGEDFRIGGVVTLPNENSGHTRAPEFFTAARIRNLSSTST